MSAGIYIHIPFCKRKCLYCDFISGCGNTDLYQKYQKSLLGEIEQTKINQRVDTIFFGGGTPSIYPVKYINQILKQIRQKECMDNETKNIEITIEANPGTLTEEKLQGYHDIGINRISIGLQSANNNELLKLGRIHTYEEFLASYENARNSGFTNINIDIMSAIPGQTMKSYQDTLKKVVELNPEHISAYSLIVEENTPFYKMYAKGAEHEKELPDEETERAMYYFTKEFLREKGYARYEISNYAKKGFECKHNKKYWERSDYYGFGVAASSLVGNLRYTNTMDLDDYIENAGVMEHLRPDKQILTRKDQMEEFMFLGLREMRGISVKDFEMQFHQSIYDIYDKVITNLIAEKLCILREDRLLLTDRGIDVSNAVLAEFLLDA